MRLLLLDAKYAFRWLVRARWTSACAVAMVGVGILTTAIALCFAELVIGRPLSIRTPEEVVSIALRDKAGRSRGVPEALFRSWSESAETVTALAASSVVIKTLNAPSLSVRSVGKQVSSEYFSVLQVTPRAGRVFAASDFSESRGTTVLIDDRIAESFGAADAVGKSIRLNDNLFTIIGVIDGSALLPGEDFIDFWIPQENRTTSLRGNQGFRLQVLGRAAADDQAIRVELAHILHAETAGDSDLDSVPDVDVRRLQEVAMAEWRTVTTALGAAALVVLIIACANSGNLLLADASSRTTEFAVRAALGADYLQLLRPIILRGLMVASTGAVIGITFVQALREPIVHLGPEYLRGVRLEDLVLTWPLAIALVGIALLTGLIFSFASAVAGVRPQVAFYLRSGDRFSSRAASTISVESFLLCLQVALSAILLTASLSMLGYLTQLSRLDYGFSSEHLIGVSIPLPEVRYDGGESVRAYIRLATERIAGLPGVAEVAAVNPLPYGRYALNASVELDDNASDNMVMASLRCVTSDYFRAMGISTLEGTLFTGAADSDTWSGAIVSKSLASAMIQDGSLTGRRLSLGSERGIPVIGVVANIAASARSSAPEYTVYRSFDRCSLQSYSTALVIRMESAIQNITPTTITSTLLAIDETVPSIDVQNFRSIIDQALALERFLTAVIAIFGLAAMLLSAVGIFAVVNRVRRKRIREIGIRIALGATGIQAVSGVVSSAVGPVAVGILVGAAGPALLSWLLPSELWRDTGHSLIYYSLSAVVLVVAAAGAIAIPALWAVRSDPSRSLRVS